MERDRHHGYSKPVQLDVCQLNRDLTLWNSDGLKVVFANTIHDPGQFDDAGNQPTPSAPSFSEKHKGLA
jgi:hypothetical protein